MVIFLRNRESNIEDINPIEFHDFALELNEIKSNLKSSESAINRTIYTRIYYSVFLFLREWLNENTSYVSPNYGEHTKLPNYILHKGPFDEKTNELIFHNLINLKKLRHQADYKLKVPSEYSKEYKKWNFMEIKEAIKVSNKIFKIFKEN